MMRIWCPVPMLFLLSLATLIHFAVTDAAPTPDRLLLVFGMVLLAILLSKGRS